MKHTLLLVLLFLFLLPGCKKDDGDAPSIQGKWTEDSVVTKEYEMNALVHTKTETGSKTTVDFQNGGSVIITDSSGTTQTLFYIVKSNSQLDINGVIYEIRNLTASTVLLVTKTDYSAGYYDEISIYLKR
jgi:hypothetical protein